MFQPKFSIGLCRTFWSALKTIKSTACAFKDGSQTGRGIVCVRVFHADLDTISPCYKNVRHWFDFSLFSHKWNGKKNQFSVPHGWQTFFLLTATHVNTPAASRHAHKDVLILEKHIFPYQFPHVFSRRSFPPGENVAEMSN